jgi:hypothetical protein
VWSGIYHWLVGSQKGPQPPHDEEMRQVLFFNP